MQLYTLIVPYYKTPEITRLALKSIRHFCGAAHETIVIDNAPGSEESAIRHEFLEVKWVENPTEKVGSAANFEAIDIGLRVAEHDLVGILHSDTIFLKKNWDVEMFGRLEEKNLAALGTFEREASPYRPLRRKIRDWWCHLTHKPTPPKGNQDKLMLYFLLTRASVLRELDFSFLRCGHVLPLQLENFLGGVETLSCVEICRFMWHTNNITSLLTGQMDDPKMWENYERKRAQLFSHPAVRELLKKG